MKIRGVDLVRKGIALFRLDPIVIAPCIIFSFMSDLVTQNLRSLLGGKDPLNVIFFQYTLGHWVLDSLFMALTLSMAIQMYLGHKIQREKVMGMVLKSYSSILVVTGISTVPMAFFLKHVLGVAATENVASGFFVLGGIGLVVMSLFIMFAPMFIMVYEKTISQALYDSVNLVWQNRRAIYVWVSIVLPMHAVGTIIGLILSQVPYFGTSVILNVIQGILMASTIILNIVFFFVLTKPRLTTIV